VLGRHQFGTVDKQRNTAHEQTEETTRHLARTYVICQVFGSDLLESVLCHALLVAVHVPLPLCAQLNRLVHVRGYKLLLLCNTRHEGGQR
jgi:hypothetical protein